MFPQSAAAEEIYYKANYQTLAISLHVTEFFFTSLQ
jgi:hypothetical protein